VEDCYQPTTGPPVGGGGWVEDCYQPTTGWGRGVVLILFLGLCEPLPITRVFGSPESDTAGAGSLLNCSISAAPIGWSSRGGVLSPQGCSPLGPIPGDPALVAQLEQESDDLRRLLRSDPAEDWEHVFFYCTKGGLPSLRRDQVAGLPNCGGTVKTTTPRRRRRSSLIIIRTT